MAKTVSCSNTTLSFGVLPARMFLQFKKSKKSGKSDSVHPTYLSLNPRKSDDQKTYATLH